MENQVLRPLSQNTIRTSFDEGAYGCSQLSWDDMVPSSNQFKQEFTRARLEAKAMHDEVRALRSQVQLYAHKMSAEKSARQALRDDFENLKKVCEEQGRLIQSLHDNPSIIPHDCSDRKI
eukprot:m.125405 g.125405  ORF g.125405 m.125405 type:complete len:120 (+) comp14493_c0_seq4:73-432(+)